MPNSRDLLKLGLDKKKSSIDGTVYDSIYDSISNQPVKIHKLLSGMRVSISEEIAAEGFTDLSTNDFMSLAKLFDENGFEFSKSVNDATNPWFLMVTDESVISRYKSVVVD